jgi:hypothetical protein
MGNARLPMIASDRAAARAWIDTLHAHLPGGRAAVKADPRGFTPIERVRSRHA